MDGEILSPDAVAELSTLGSKEALYSKVLGTMLAPITALAVCLGQILEQKGGALEAPAEAAQSVCPQILGLYVVSAKTNLKN